MDKLRSKLDEMKIRHSCRLVESKGWYIVHLTFYLFDQEQVVKGFSKKEDEAYFKAICKLPKSWRREL